MRGRTGKLASAIAALAILPTAALAEPLRVVGNIKVMEIAPLVVAAETSGEKVEIALGGVPNLWTPEMPSLTLAVSAGASASVKGPSRFTKATSAARSSAATSAPGSRWGRKSPVATTENGIAT